MSIKQQRLLPVPREDDWECLSGVQSSQGDGIAAFAGFVGNLRRRQKQGKACDASPIHLEFYKSGKCFRSRSSACKPSIESCRELESLYLITGLMQA